MIQEELNIALIQSKLHWQDIPSNLKSFDKAIQEITNVDLIVLPEMFSTGFSMNVEEAYDSMDGQAVSWMRKKAQEKNTVITGSVTIRTGDKYFNRLIWMRPNGSHEFYDKRHLFRMADEDAHFDGGNKRLIVELKGWKVCPLICYDLRFPVWSRNKYRSEDGQLIPEYDVLLYVANWPAARVNAWDILLSARAVENQCYTIGLNRVGKDDNEIEYVGHSAVVDPKGQYIIEPRENEEKVIYARLDYVPLKDYREKFPQGLDADRFKLLE